MCSAQRKIMLIEKNGGETRVSIDKVVCFICLLFYFCCNFEKVKLLERFGFFGTIVYKAGKTQIYCMISTVKLV